MIGNKLRRLRQNRQLTQAEVANAIHCDRSYLSRIETDDTSPSLEILEALCHFYGVPLSDIILATPVRDRTYDLVVKRCLSLLHQGRRREAQTLAASAWWDCLTASSDVADRLFNILTVTPTDDPAVLTITLATMFRSAASGRIDNNFFQLGYQIQRALGDEGELQAAQILCQALLALDPRPPEAFRLTLSLGTTLLRSGDLHMASAMYEKARLLWGEKFGRVNLGRAVHGLGACELHWENAEQAIVYGENACNLYRVESPELFYLALQNVALSYRLAGRSDKALQALEQCAQYWEDQKHTEHLREVEALLHMRNY